MTIYFAHEKIPFKPVFMHMQTIFFNAKFMHF